MNTSMMRFDSAASSFLALIVIESYKKPKVQLFQRKVSRFPNEKRQN